MEIRPVMDLRTPDGSAVPAVEVMAEPVRGGAVLLHGYGGCKEQTLWLAFALARMGVCTLAIDLAGHGENHVEAGPRMLDEVEAAIDSMRNQFELVGCAGVELGGRLALMSSADYMAAIAPPALTGTLERPHRGGVREPQPGYLPRLLQELGPVAPCERQCLLVYVAQDATRSQREFEEALMHAEVRNVLSDGDFALNADAIEITARWIAQMPGLLTMSRRVHAQ